MNLPKQYVAPCGIAYELTRKRVKNLNLRVRADGTVALSAPAWIPLSQADAFVDSRARWIRSARQRAAQRQAQDLVPCRFTPQEALEIFRSISDQIFPLFSTVLDGKPPELKVRAMKTRWGVCAPSRRRITLSQRLAEYPADVIRYVILHEYAHFIHCDHSPAFWAVVERYEPRWKALRARLRLGPDG